jgi:hypothetical protein
MQDLHFHVETTDEIVAQRTQENYKRAYLLEQEQAVVIRLRMGCDFLMARANFTVLSERSTGNHQLNGTTGELALILNDSPAHLS